MEAGFNSLNVIFYRLCEGYLLPENPLLEDNDLGKSRWRCSRCSVSEPAHKILTVLERIGLALNSMKKGDQRACESFITQYSSELHANHYYLTDVKLALAQLYGQDSQTGLPGVGEQDLCRKIILCRQVLTLINTLVPGKLCLILTYLLTP